MRQLKLREQFNLSGIVIALCAFTFGPWLANHSAVWIINDLRLFFTQVDANQNTGRQQLILIILIGIAVSLVLLPICFNRMTRMENRRWLFAEMGVCGTAVLLMGVLYFFFDARALGLVLTAFGCLLSLCAASYCLYLHNQATDVKKDDPPPSNIEEPIQPEPDPMIRFQNKLSLLYQDCVGEKRPFNLILIGVAYFDSYQTIYGEEALSMVNILRQKIEQIVPAHLAVAFSSGVVMAAFPDATNAEIDAQLRGVETEMQAHGFAGEMLLPGGKLQLLNVIVTAGQDGNSLSQLNENALSEYAQALAQMPG